MIYILNAQNQILGRFASQISKILIEKHNTNFKYNKKNDNFIIVINANKILMTKKKMSQKKYYLHSGYPGGLKIKKFSSIKKIKPHWLIEKAVKNMLPKSNIGRNLYKKLKIKI